MTIPGGGGGGSEEGLAKDHTFSEFFLRPSLKNINLRMTVVPKLCEFIWGAKLTFLGRVKTAPF